MLEQSDRSADPLGCLPRLQQVAAQAGKGKLPPQAAGDLAVALGQLELFGLQAPADLPRVLTVEQTRDAAREWCERLSGSVEAARRFARDWEGCHDSVEAERLTLDLLRKRMDAWAAWLAIDQGYDQALDQGATVVAEVAALIDRLLAALDEFDAALQKEEALLATAAETSLLDDWRAQLVEPYRLARPWWLAGRLEARGRQAAEADAADRFFSQLAARGKEKE
jgi:hypothetical protein